MKKLKAFFGQFEKVEKPQKRPQRKVWQYRTVSRVLTGVGIVFLLFVLITFGRAFFLQSQVISLEEKIVQLEQRLTNQGLGVDEHAMRHYLGNFMRTYINVPVANEQRVERQKTLNNFYAKNVVIHAAKGESERKLTNATLIKVEQVDEKLQATFQVGYEITDQVVKERTTDGKKEKYVDLRKKTITNYMIVPFTQKDNKFQIVGEPYVTTNPVIWYQESVAEDVLNNKITDTATMKKLDTFVLNFLSKYHSGVTNDLAYLMENPSSLNKQMTVKGLVKQEYDLLSDGTVKAYVTVDLLDSGTQFIKTERYILTLVNKDNNYIVRQIEH